MTDTQELAAAITAAIQAPRTPGPRDPKYESLEVMPETGSPDLLERSAFRSFYRTFRVKFLLTMVTYGILPYLQASAHHHTGNIKLKDFDGIGSWTGDNGIQDNDDEIKKCEDRAYFYLFHVLHPNGHWSAIRDKARNDDMPVLHFIFRLDEQYLRSTLDTVDNARTNLYNTVHWAPRQTLSSFYLAFDQAVTDYEYEKKYCESDGDDQFTMKPRYHPKHHPQPSLPTLQPGYQNMPICFLICPTPMKKKHNTQHAKTQ